MDQERVQHNRMKTMDSWSVFCFDSLAPLERQEEGYKPIRFKSGLLSLTTEIPTNHQEEAFKALKMEVSTSKLAISIQFTNNIQSEHTKIMREPKKKKKKKKHFFT